jgi:ankyrin repeat protein
MLLHLDENITRDSLTEFPLAEYAAEYWFEHARVDTVSKSLTEGMKQLFDETKPHFSVWLWICDPFAPGMKFHRTEMPLRPAHGTPLHYAALCGLCDVVTGLAIDLKDVNFQHCDGESTPLYLSSQEGHIKFSRTLIELGANAAVQDKRGRTPLHEASSNGHLDIARVLVKHGANVAAQDRLRSTPLHKASSKGHLNIARFLIEHGANAAAQDRRKCTQLHEASRSGHLDIAQFLIEHGANVAAMGPLHLASSHGHLDIARILVEHGADAAAQDQGGSTPLDEASSKGHFHVAQFLAKRSANAVAQATPQIQQSTTASVGDPTT